MRLTTMAILCALASVPACAQTQPDHPVEAPHATPEQGPAVSWRRAFPEGVLGERLRTFLDLIAQRDGATLDAIVDDAFFAHTPREQLEANVAQMIVASGGELTFLRTLRVSDTALAVELTDTQGIVWTAQLRLAEGADRLAGLDVRAQGFRPEGVKVYDTWREVLADVGALEGDVGFCVRRIGVGGINTPLALHGQDEVLNIGQLGQLFTLGALGEAIEQGALSWDDTTTIEARHRSIPPSEYAEASEGAPFTLRELAQGMGALRDSAASDAVFDLVGRERVEAYYAELTDDHERTAPFLTMRQFALLKLFTSDEARERYAQGDTETRAGMLAGVPDDADLSLNLDERLALWREARAVDSIGWFATPDELVRTLDDLRTKSSDTGTMLPLAQAMLAKVRNPLSDEAWPGAVLKSGGEPGVLATAWMLRRYDGAWFSVVLVINDDDGLVDATEPARILVGIADLLTLED